MYIILIIITSEMNTHTNIHFIIGSVTLRLSISTSGESEM